MRFAGRPIASVAGVGSGLPSDADGDTDGDVAAGAEASGGPGGAVIEHAATRSMTASARTKRTSAVSGAPLAEVKGLASGVIWLMPESHHASASAINATVTGYVSVRPFLMNVMSKPAVATSQPNPLSVTFAGDVTVADVMLP